MKNKLNLLIALAGLALAFSGCRKSYVAVQLPELSMAPPKVYNLDSVFLKATIIDNGFEEVEIVNKGFILALEDIDSSGKGVKVGQWWELPGKPAGSPLEFTAQKSELKAGVFSVSNQYAAAPFLDLAYPNGTTQRIFGSKRFFNTGRISLDVNNIEADNKITLTLNLAGINNSDGVEEYGIAWLDFENVQPEPFTFEIEDTPEESRIVFGPIAKDTFSLQVTPGLPLGKYIYLRPFFVYKGQLYAGEIQELFIGNYWERRGIGSGFSPGPHTLGYAVADNNYGYLLSGRTSTTTYFSSLRRYDPIEDSWSNLPGLPSEVKRKNAVAFLIGEYIYIGLGSTSNPKRDFFEYHIPSNTWRQVEPYPFACEKAVSFEINGKAYVGTGRLNPNIQSKKFYEFDPTKGILDENGLPRGVWNPVDDFPYRVEGAVGFSLGNKGYVGLGFSVPETFHKEFYEFDPNAPTEEQWKAISPYAGAGRQFAMAFTINENKAFVGGGALFARQYIYADYNDFWEYGQQADAWKKIADIGILNRAGGAAFSIGEVGYVFGGNIAGAHTVLSSELSAYIMDR